MKIGILQTGRSPQSLREKHGDYNEFFMRLLANRGFEFTTYAVLDSVFPLSLDEMEGWIITGSRFGVYEEHVWIKPLEALLRRIYEQGAPMIGICFGHQILAQALGGKVEKFSGGWSVGATEYDFKPLQACGSLMAWHQDQVVELPPQARVVASSNFCRYAMLEYEGKALSLQPHPEFDTEFVRDLLDARKADLPTDIVEHANQHMDRELNREEIADLFERFLKGVSE